MLYKYIYIEYISSVVPFFFVKHTIQFCRKNPIIHIYILHKNNIVTSVETSVTSVTIDPWDGSGYQIVFFPVLFVGWDRLFCLHSHWGFGWLWRHEVHSLIAQHKRFYVISAPFASVTSQSQQGLERLIRKQQVFAMNSPTENWGWLAGHSSCSFTVLQFSFQVTVKRSSSCLGWS